jgi:hypothetical protein
VNYEFAFAISWAAIFPLLGCICYLSIRVRELREDRDDLIDRGMKWARRAAELGAIVDRCGHHSEVHAVIDRWEAEDEKERASDAH